jgi:hypothetical protein
MHRCKLGKLIDSQGADGKVIQKVVDSPISADNLSFNLKQEYIGLGEAGSIGSSLIKKHRAQTCLCYVEKAGS